MNKIRILWTDDEIDILRPHIIFLEEKGYEILTASNAEDALSIVEEEELSLIFLDENMPGKPAWKSYLKLSKLSLMFPL